MVLYKEVVLQFFIYMVQNVPFKSTMSRCFMTLHVERSNFKSVRESESSATARLNFLSFVGVSISITWITLIYRNLYMPSAH